MFPNILRILLFTQAKFFLMNDFRNQYYILSCAKMQHKIKINQLLFLWKLSLKGILSLIGTTPIYKMTEQKAPNKSGA